ncbi:MAG: rhodanese-like domain-containing protein [Acidobacteria bacterium]|nr:rhodanese-like domain-containing protein [Acidobacteriota bacterium]
MKRFTRLVPAAVVALAAIGGTWAHAGAQGVPPVRGGMTVRPITQDPTASVPRVSLEELKKLIAADDVLIVDVRGDETYREGHIPGAISIPLADVEKRAGELRKTPKKIVTYCS